MENSERLRKFGDLVALLHHEARNVRHLIDEGFIESAPWESSISLARSRDKAWRQMSPVRAKASKAASADEVLRVFEDRFKRSLTDLVEMFGNPNWRHARLYGGNAWQRIGALVIDLATALRAGADGRAEQLISEIMTARHNTGVVSDKLARLEEKARTS